MSSNHYPVFLEEFAILNQKLNELLALEKRFEDVHLDYEALQNLELEAPLRYLTIISHDLEAALKDTMDASNEMEEIKSTTKDDLFRLRTTGNGVIIQTGNEVGVLKKAKEMGSYPFYINYLASNPDIPAIRAECKKHDIKSCVATPYTPPNPDDFKRMEEDQEMAKRSRSTFDYWSCKKD